jgi:hypothetical protein
MAGQDAPGLGALEILSRRRVRQTRLYSKPGDAEFRFNPIGPGDSDIKS